MGNGEGFKKRENVPAKKGQTLSLYDGKIQDVFLKKLELKQYFGKFPFSVNVYLYFIFLDNVCKCFVTYNLFNDKIKP